MVQSTSTGTSLGDLKVPRYTSYPTAPHFTELVSGLDYARWLGDLDTEEPVSLYVHVPFCKSMCWFCGCQTKITARYEPVATYVDLLLSEIDLVSKKLPGKISANHVHWGGGSPTLLAPTDWTRITKGLSTVFEVTETCDAAVEIDPRTATEDFIQAIAVGGVTRVSLGIQDFDPTVQSAINRVQPFDMTRDVVSWCRREGISGLNLDLMYGLPHQTPNGLMATIEQAISLEPDTISLFGYAHVPWMKAHQRLIDPADTPQGTLRQRLYELAADKINSHDFNQIGLDHFARPESTLAKSKQAGTLRRNFQGYTTDQADTLIGFGASAISRTPEGYAQNESSLKTYQRCLEASQLPTARGVGFDGEDRLRGEVIETLMCGLSVDVGDVCQKHARTPDSLDDEIQGLERYARDALLSVEGRTITMTEKGRPFVRLAAAAFDEYLATGTGKHSAAL